MRILLAISLVALLITGCADTGNEIAGNYQPYPPTISVTGTGTAVGVADMAIISFSINIADVDAGIAVEDDRRLADEVIQAITDLGVSEEKVETINYSLRNEEEYDYNTYEYTGESLYQLEHSFTVKVENIHQTGDVMDALLNTENISVSDIKFTVSNRDELIAEARTNALVHARETAEQLAEGLDIVLGHPVSVSEWIDSYSDYDYDSYADDYYPESSNGNTAVTLNVSVAFAIE